MASSISLGYHQLAQKKRADDQLHDRETNKIRQNELISNLDRASRERVAAADRASAEKRDKYKADSSYAGTVYSADSSRAASKYSADTSAAASKYAANSKYAETVYKAAIDQAINEAKLKNELDKIEKTSDKRILETALGMITSGDLVDYFGANNLIHFLAGEEADWKMPVLLGTALSERDRGAQFINNVIGSAGSVLRGASGFRGTGRTMAQPSWGNSNLY